MQISHPYVRWVYTPRFCLITTKIWNDIKALACHSSRVLDRPCYMALRQISVTALFYLENSKRIHPQGWGHADSKTQRGESGGARQRAVGVEVGRGEREREREKACALAPLFICFFLPLGLPSVSRASQEYCLFYLRSSLRSWNLPLTFLCSIFTGFSLPCLLATAILDSVS